MEFCERLQELRKQKGLTQDELAKALFVSRTAVSKWESGRGYPNIDSLKMLAKFFSVTVDELLSSDEILTIAEKDGNQKEKRIKGLIFGLLDIGAAMLLFLPFFAQKDGEIIHGVPLFDLSVAETGLKAVYFSFVVGMILMGSCTLILQNFQGKIWLKVKEKLSLALNALSAVLFMLGRHPYPSVFLFVFLMIKCATLIKWR